MRLIKPELQHYLGSFLLQGAMMIAMTTIPFFCFQHLGGKERAAALAYGVQTLSLGITCLISAPFVSRWRNGLIGCLIGSLGFGTFYFLASFASSVVVFCVLTGIAMSFFALAWPAMQSWLGAQPDMEKRAKSFSYFNVAIGLGLIAGPLIEGALYQVNFRAAFLAVFVFSLFAGALLVTLPSEDAWFGIDSRITQSGNGHLPKKNRANEIFLYCGWLTNMLGWGLTGAVRTVYAGQVNALVQHGRMLLFSASAPGHIFTAQQSPTAAALYSGMQAMLSLGYFLAILALGRTLQWQHRFSVLIVFETALGLSIWKLADSRSLVVILACHTAMGAFAAFGYLGSQCYSAANITLKHRRIAINEGLSQSSSFALPLIFAQCAASYGIAWPFRYVWLVIAVFAVLQAASLRYAQRNFQRGLLVAHSTQL